MWVIAVKLTALVVVVVLAAPSFASAQDVEGRTEAGVFLTYVFLERIGSRDSGPGTGAAGLGGRVSRRMSRYLDAEGELVVHPNAGVSGHRVQAMFGARAGVRFKRVGLFAKARPGVIWFSKDPFGVGRAGPTIAQTQWAHSLDASADLGGVFEYYTPRGLIVRFDLADTIVRYGARAIVTQRDPPRPVGGFVTHNRQWTLGVGMRF